MGKFRFRNGDIEKFLTISDKFSTKEIERKIQNVFNLAQDQLTGLYISDSDQYIELENLLTSNIGQNQVLELLTQNPSLSSSFEPETRPITFGRAPSPSKVDLLQQF